MEAKYRDRAATLTPRDSWDRSLSGKLGTRARDAKSWLEAMDKGGLSTAVLYPIVIGIVIFGVYSIHYSMSDVTIALIAGALGYVMLKLDYSPVPLVLGLVLGPLLERGVRRTLIVSEGHLSIFVQQPIALALFALTIGVLVLPFITRRLLAKQN